VSAGRIVRRLAALGLLPLCAECTAPGRAAPTPSDAVAPPDPGRFVADAREGTRRYQSQQAAVDDGFTRVGAEFPAMGEHWVSYARVMEDSVDAGRPSILIYVNGAGGPRLSGVAYTKLLAGPGGPPTFPRAGAWHEHSGGVDEESLPIRHSARDHATSGREARPARPGDTAAAPADAPRLYVLHAWVWTPNPDGVFVTDNWTLPFARLGVRPPATRARNAACTLALADDRDGYHRATLDAALALSTAEDSLAARVLARHRGRAEHAARLIREAGDLTTPAAARLAAGCDSLWSDLEAALPQRAADLRRLRRHM
jgi:hypothetical protein